MEKHLYFYSKPAYGVTPYWKHSENCWCKNKKTDDIRKTMGKSGDNSKYQWFEKDVYQFEDVPKKKGYTVRANLIQENHITFTVFAPSQREALTMGKEHIKRVYSYRQIETLIARENPSS